MALIFEWDPVKERANRRKHGVSFDEGSTVFGDPLSLTIRDPLGSSDEQRFVIMGVGFRGQLLVVAHTERQGRVRIISARPASRRERQQYEEG